MCHRLPRALLVLTCLCLFPFTPQAATKARIQWCDARFIVPGARLTLAPAAAPAFDVVALGAQRIRIANCAAVTPRGKALRDGSIKLSATWKNCGGFKKLVLRGTLDADCTRLAGVMKAKKWKPRFTATASSCGDGMLDAGNAEECEPAGGPTCSQACRAIVAPPLTSTTVTPVTSTTVTSTTMPGCGALCGNGQIDAGCGEECDGDDMGDAACPVGGTPGAVPECTGDCRLDLSECGCDGGAFTSTWEAIQTVVFAHGQCADAVCHGSPALQGGLDLTPVNAYANLVDVHAANGPLLRVKPEEPEESELFLRLAARTAPGAYDAPHGTPMPLGAQPAITENALEVLKRWIRVGAPDEGVVLGTAELLNVCLPPPTPQKIDPLPPPPAGEGLQLYAPPWPIPADDEDEVCYATYYNVTKVAGLVPDDALVPCPSLFLGPTNPSQQCWAYKSSVLAQDPNSHHSLIYVYSGVLGVGDASWGAWTCKGGPHDGLPCDPTRIGEPATAGGADCGPRSGCTTPITTGVGCIGFGPYDYQQTNIQIGGSQEPRFDLHFAPGAYAPMPSQGVIVWNSHGFNLTDIPTTNEQYLNLDFAQQSAGDQRFQVQPLFDSRRIFWDGESVLPFQSREFCATHTFDPNTQLFYMSSHTHRFGRRFRVWEPPNASCQTVLGCLPDETRTPLYESTDYTDPVQLYFDPPVAITAPEARNRRYKFCSLYDNGASDPGKVKRRSTSPAAPPPLTGLLGGPCAITEVACMDGPRKGQPCGGGGGGEPDHAVCDSSPGLGDGLCDACPVKGGVTTEDEMFILLGAFYIAP